MFVRGVNGDWDWLRHEGFFCLIGFIGFCWLVWAVDVISQRAVQGCLYSEHSDVGVHLNVIKWPRCGYYTSDICARLNMSLLASRQNKWQITLTPTSYLFIYLFIYPSLLLFISQPLVQRHTQYALKGVCVGQCRVQSCMLSRVWMLYWSGDSFVILYTRP